MNDVIGISPQIFRAEIVSVEPEAHTLSIHKDGAAELVRVAIPDDAELLDAMGQSVDIDYFSLGMSVEVAATEMMGELRADRIREVVRTDLAYYLNPDFHIFLQYPTAWRPNSRHGNINGIPTHFEGRDGFFTIDAMAVENNTIEEAVGNVAYHKLKPYGDAPDIIQSAVEGQEAVLIIPREDALKNAALVVRYPKEIKINGSVYSFFVMYTDKEHIQNLARTVTFFENSPEEQKLARVSNILVYQPRAGDSVSGSFTATGFARVFENQFIVRLSTQNAGILVEDAVSTRAPNAGMFGYFEHEVSVSGSGLAKLKSNPEAILEVFEYSARDGLEVSKVSLPIMWEADSIETVRVSIFFPNSKMGSLDICTEVYPVPREIIKTKTVATAVLEELLQGPTSGEREKGYFTNINEGVHIQRLAIQNGVASVDFDEALDRAVAGSCRVTSIRSEITQTLKQFPGVQSVVISMNGRTEDILQP